jgi:hypothetical protein
MKKMTLILVFLGWLIVSSLWGFLPIIQPLRQFAETSAEHRKQAAIASGLLAFITGALTGVLILYWVTCSFMMQTFAYYAHGASPLLQGLTEAQVSSRIIPVANETMLQTIFPGNSCLIGDPTTCEITSRVIHGGFDPTGTLPLTIGISIFLAIIPAYIAARINWKLTTALQQTKNDML